MGRFNSSVCLLDIFFPLFAKYYNGSFFLYIGMMFSSTFWGHVSDKYGRRRALLLSGIYLFVYGLLSSFSTSYEWILFLRFLVGFNIGCVPQSVTLFAEFLPTKQRAKCVVLMDCFWAFGACLEVLLVMSIFY